MSAPAAESDSIRPELKRAIAARFPNGTLTALAGDASTRRFYRCQVDGASWMIMDYGAAFDPPTNDQRLTTLYQQAQLPAPSVEHADGPAGYLALEDLGDTMLETEILNSPCSFLEFPDEPDSRIEGRVQDANAEHELSDMPCPAGLLEAAELAARIVTRGTPVLRESERKDGPALDEARFQFEMEFFAEHFAKQHLGRTLSPGLRDELSTLAVAATRAQPHVLCHRDFHSRNLMRTPDGLAMVDLQDSQWGAEGYDLASILFDAYLPIPDRWRTELFAAYVARRPALDTGKEFAAALVPIALERCIKALGTFGYQESLGRTRYRIGIPRTLRRIRGLFEGQAGLASVDPSGVKSAAEAWSDLAELWRAEVDVAWTR